MQGVSIKFLSRIKCLDATIDKRTELVSNTVCVIVYGVVRQSRVSSTEPLSWPMESYVV